MSQPANAWGSSDVAAVKYSLRKADGTCDSVVPLSVFCCLLLRWYTFTIGIYYSGFYVLCC